MITATSVSAAAVRPPMGHATPRISGTGAFAGLVDTGEAPMAANSSGAAGTVSGQAGGTLLQAKMMGSREGARGFVSLDALAVDVRKATADLSQRLTSRLRESGIDTGTPFSLKVNGDGSVSVAGDHPDKARIEALFKDDPDLANDFRGVCAQNGFVAAGRLASRYVEAWNEADDDEERKQVWEKYHRLFKQMESLSSTMTFAGGELTSPAQQFVDGLMTTV